MTFPSRNTRLLLAFTTSVGAISAANGQSSPTSKPPTDQQAITTANQLANGSPTNRGGLIPTPADIAHGMANLGFGSQTQIANDPNHANPTGASVPQAAQTDFGATAVGIGAPLVNSNQQVGAIIDSMTPTNPASPEFQGNQAAIRANQHDGPGYTTTDLATGVTTWHAMPPPADYTQMDAYMQQYQQNRAQNGPPTVRDPFAQPGTDGTTGTADAPPAPPVMPQQPTGPNYPTNAPTADQNAAYRQKLQADAQQAAAQQQAELDAENAAIAKAEAAANSAEQARQQDEQQRIDAAARAAALENAKWNAMVANDKQDASSLFAQYGTLTTVQLLPIYKNSNPLNSSPPLVSPSSAMQTPSKVMTAPSTQVAGPSKVMTAPSTQVAGPSKVMTVPSTQIAIPSTQVQGPSSVMTAPSTQIAGPSSVMTAPSNQIAGPSTQLVTNAGEDNPNQAVLCGR